MNEAVISRIQEGVLTSTILMVTGPAFEQAVNLAKENPGLAVGIPLVRLLERACFRTQRFGACRQGR